MGKAHFKVLILCLYLTDNGISFDGHFLKHSSWILNLKHILFDLHGPFPVWNLLAESSPLPNKELHPVQGQRRYWAQTCPAGQCYPRNCVAGTASWVSVGYSVKRVGTSFLVGKSSLFGIWNPLPAQPIHLCGAAFAATSPKCGSSFCLQTDRCSLISLLPILAEVFA